jgi:hypothetical protein
MVSVVMHTLVCMFMFVWECLDVSYILDVFKLIVVAGKSKLRWTKPIVQESIFFEGILINKIFI